MTKTISRKFTSRLQSTPNVEEMLRDIAYVLHLTKKVKASMIADAAQPTGGRFEDTEERDTKGELYQMAVA